MVHTRRSLLSSKVSSPPGTPLRGAVSRSTSARESTSTARQEKKTVTLRKARSTNYSRAQGTAVKPLHGREREFSTICNWIEKTVCDGQPLSLYISGSPGTGKTATIRLVLEHFDRRILSSIVNCASVHTQNELTKIILGTLESSAKPSLSALSRILEELQKPLILVLDEIDLLATKTNSFLYTAFQWPYTLTSKLIVIGIANSIDLTERLLPKLKLGHAPQTLVFTPYSKEEIAEIIKDKMSAEADDGMDAKAVELCSRKVAAMSGDLRAALHVIKHTRQVVYSTAVNLNEPATPRGCREVLGVLNGVYSSPLARARLPLQPRLILAVALAMSFNKKSSLDLNSLTNAYSRACDVVKVPRLEGDDFAAAMQILESQSFLMECPGRKLVLKVDTDTARSAIADTGMIAQISALNL
ncbi:ATPase, AAA family [Oesophagostomum dentatum]|uniref:ATPase, AAA family n=1 Tax=Oesophagostomum dentatum TaxID=61180 RepID=A0A0B1TPY5_OESDE|nr:ATPase, AAA family [Oesophagostomum dentatum]